MEINTEFLLGRKEIILDDENARKQIYNRRILITGAAGSIGSELVKQIVKFQPSSLCLVDHWELGIHQLKLLLHQFRGITLVIGDVTDKNFMSSVFEEAKPEIVFHAAAYKHVSLLEDSPYQAIKNNILGTQIVADLSKRLKVEKFIFISTDKAVNPAGLMGITKQLSEIYLQNLNRHKKSATQFIITRFGNVFASNGSVYHTFKYQLTNELPITISDRKASRYFMTLLEASQFVLEAASIGKDGDILLFNMGEPVLIFDLARRMIQESTLKTGKKVEIRFTSLGRGEKLHEVLCPEEDILMPTEHKLINRDSSSKRNNFNVKIILSHLRKAIKTKKADELRLILKNIFNHEETHQPLKEKIPLPLIRNGSVQMHIPTVHMD